LVRSIERDHTAPPERPKQSHLTLIGALTFENLGDEALHLWNGLFDALVEYLERYFRAPQQILDSARFVYE
jgi:hypothetical protein